MSSNRSSRPESASRVLRDRIPPVIRGYVLRSQDMLCDHAPCPTFAVHVSYENKSCRVTPEQFLLSQDVSSDHDTSPPISRNALRSRATCCDRWTRPATAEHDLYRRTCPVIARQDMSCDRGTFPVIAGPALWSQDVFCDRLVSFDRKICLGIARHGSSQQHMACDHRGYPVLVRNVARSQHTQHTQTQGHRDTETQRHRDTQTHRHTDT